MRILGKQHDFYDSVLAYGTDSKRVVFMRELQEFKSEQVPAIALARVNGLSHPRRTNNLEMDFTCVTVGLCGKIYRGININVVPRMYNDGGFARLNKTVYDFNSFMAIVKEHEVELSTARYKWQKLPEIEDQIKAYFAAQGTNEWEDFMVTNKLVTLTNGMPYSSIYQGNGTLKQYEFYRVLDAFQTYQEIDMYVSGTLTTPDAPMIELTEKDRVAQHGFDKYSFRHRPK